MVQGLLYDFLGSFRVLEFKQKFGQLETHRVLYAGVESSFIVINSLKDSSQIRSHMSKKPIVQCMKFRDKLHSPKIKKSLALSYWCVLTRAWPIFLASVASLGVIFTASW